MQAPPLSGVLTAAFRGTREASGPLTVGQRNVLMWIDEDSNKWSSVIPLFHPLPDGLDPTAVAIAVAELVSRHEALRTHYPSAAVQQVIRDGELPVEVCELTGDDTEFVLALEARLCDRPFDLATELPVRAAIVTRDGRPALLVLIICHMAVDVGSVAVLARELTALLAGDPLPAPGVQPLEAAAAEAAPLGRRRAAAAVRHWESTLASAPLRLAVPARPGAVAAIPGRVRMTSRAGALALTRLTRGSGAGRSATVLAAVAAVLGLRTGTGTCLFASVSGNRFHAGLGGYVGPLAQDALVSFALGGGTFTQLVTRAWTAQLSGYRHSRFDADDVWAVLEDVQHRRGAYFGRDWVFNDVGGHVAAPHEPPCGDVAAALPETRFDWTDVSHVPVMLFFRLVGVLDALDLELHFDARYFPPDDVEKMLRGVERLLVAAAEADVPLADLAAVTGCELLQRGAGWQLVGSSWVELAAVESLLAEVAGTSAVAVEADGRLTGFVVGGDPERIHAACVAALADRPTAITPARYVVCTGAPQDPSDLDAWRAMPVAAEGDGR